MAPTTPKASAASLTYATLRRVNRKKHSSGSILYLPKNGSNHTHGETRLKVTTRAEILAEMKAKAVAEAGAELKAKVEAKAKEKAKPASNPNGVQKRQKNGPSFGSMAIRNKPESKKKGKAPVG